MPNEIALSLKTKIQNQIHTRLESFMMDASMQIVRQSKTHQLWATTTRGERIPNKNGGRWISKRGRKLQLQRYKFRTHTGKCTQNACCCFPLDTIHQKHFLCKSFSLDDDKFHHLLFFCSKVKRELANSPAENTFYPSASERELAAATSSSCLNGTLFSWPDPRKQLLVGNTARSWAAPSTGTRPNY